MKSFFKSFFASLLAFFVFVFLVFVAGLAIVSTATATEEVRVKDNSVLVMRIKREISDKATEDAIGIFENEETGTLGLNQIISTLQKAADDDRIKGISMEMNDVAAGLAQLQEIRQELLDFKESGKFIAAYADNYSQRAYYLESVADSIFLNPVGSVDLKGLSAEVLFFKKFQEKYGIKMDVIRHGKYKSAVEPFLEEEMSPANREQTTALIYSIWETFSTDIAASRKMERSELDLAAANRSGLDPEKALSNRLIDGIRHFDEYEQAIKDYLGSSSYNRISLSKYSRAKLDKSPSNPERSIAVLYAQGDIQYGKGGPMVIGQKMIVEALQKIRKNKKVDALVFRVNSPGGDAMASDIILREIMLTQQEMPVVVSMGNYAASGGYYISCSADHIVADASTITGSIGVFGMVPNAEEFGDRIGINSDYVQTHDNAFEFSIFSGMSDNMRDIALSGVERTYATFVNHVAEGRGMSPEEVDKIGQGRVWSGSQALELGLVDELGGLDAALAKAAELADLEEYKIRSYPDYPDPFEELIDQLSGNSAQEGALRDALGEDLYWMFSSLRNVADKQAIYARMPYEIRIK